MIIYFPSLHNEPSFPVKGSHDVNTMKEFRQPNEQHLLTHTQNKENMGRVQTANPAGTLRAAPARLVTPQFFILNEIRRVTRSGGLIKYLLNVFLQLFAVLLSTIICY